MTVELMYKDKVMTRAVVDEVNKTVSFENFTDDNIRRMFGCKKTATYEDFERFLERRCFPRTRDNASDLLNTLGLTEYNPIEIVKKTSGKMAHDTLWVRFS
ncbi:MAG: hypothetical protein ACLT4F_09550 [Clostridia bacterium]|jgi:putative transcriptional regulator